MVKKLETLVSINAIMKQRIEQRLSKILQERKTKEHQIKSLRARIIDKQNHLAETVKTEPLSASYFANWKTAQDRRIEILQKEVISFDESIQSLKEELAKLLVREQSLEKQMSDQIAAIRLKQQKFEAEQGLTLWTQKSYS